MVDKSLLVPFAIIFAIILILLLIEYLNKYKRNTRANQYRTAGQFGISNIQQNLSNPTPTSDLKFNFIGCYNDNPSNRLFPKQSTDYKTIEECAALAQSVGAKYFGMQDPKSSGNSNKAECFVGFNTNFSQLGSASCPTLLQDNFARPLGDQNINAVYSLTSNVIPASPPTGAYEYINCYLDNPTYRILPYGNGVYSTVDDCWRRASQAGASYFGLEFPEHASVAGTGQCWYGNGQYAQNGVSPSCNNNPLGSSDSLAVYKINIPYTSS